MTSTTTATFSQCVSRSASISTAGPTEVLQEQFSDNNLRISFNSRIHQWRRPHAQQDNSFAPLASYNKFFWIKGVQHPEWASPRHNNKNGSQQFNTMSSTLTSRRTPTSCTTLSTTTSSIKSCGTTSSIEKMYSTLTFATSRWTRRTTTIFGKYNKGPQAQQSRWRHQTECEGIRDKNTTETDQTVNHLWENPTTTRRTTWVRYNNMTPTQWRSATWSTQLRYASIPTSSSTTWWASTSATTSDWERYSTRGMHRSRLHQQWAPNTSGQQRVLHTTIFSRIVAEEITGIRIDIDTNIQEKDIDIACTKLSTTVSGRKALPQQRPLREQLCAQRGPSSVQQLCWRSTSQIAQPGSSMMSSHSPSTSGSKTVLLSSTSGAHNSTPCHRWSLIVPSKGVTTTRCTSTSVRSQQWQLKANKNPAYERYSCSSLQRTDDVEQCSGSSTSSARAVSWSATSTTSILQQAHHSKFIDEGLLTKSPTTSPPARAISSEKSRQDLHRHQDHHQQEQFSRRRLQRQEFSNQLHQEQSVQQVVRQELIKSKQINT